MNLRFGFRLLRNNPGFTVVAVLTLALGIGANTAIFSLLDALVYRQLPVPAAEELYSLTDLSSSGIINGNENGVRSLLSWAEFLHFRDRGEVFRGLFASSSETARQEALFDSDRFQARIPVQISLVSGAYFDVLGVPPQLGSIFGVEADDPGRVRPVAVLSDAFWERQFARTPAVLGRRIRIFDGEYQVIGVMPRGFFGETVGRVPDFWVPLLTQPMIYPGQDFLASGDSIMTQTLWLNVLGRLRPGISPERAEVALNLQLDQFVESRFEAGSQSAALQTLLQQTIQLTPAATGASPLRRRYQTPLQAMMWMVVLVLLIACANVANLLLARGRARSREVGIRLALGSGRLTLIGQFLTESLLLSLIGGAVGLLVALWVESLLISFAADNFGVLRLQLNGRILLFCFLVSTLSGIVFGLIPAARSVGRDLTLALKGLPGVDSSGRPNRNLGRTLVVSQIALSVLLLVVTGLFVKSLQNTAAVNVGFDKDQLATALLPLAEAGYEKRASLDLVDQILTRVEQLPGVISVAASHNGLFSNSESGDPISVEGYEPAPGQRLNSRYDHVTPGYFATVGIPLLRGREMAAADGRSGPRVGLINETFAARFFAGRDPLGKRISNVHPDNPGEIEIIGVVKDAKYNNLREETPARFYAPFLNPLFFSSDVALLVRARNPDASLFSRLSKELGSLGPGLDRIRFHAMSELVDRTLGRERLLVRVTSFFGALALVLATIGIYGILAYEVTSRAPEIGIRVALGASHLSLIWMVLRETFLLVGCGLALGIPAVSAVARLAAAVTSQLFEVKTTDPAVLIGTALVMAVFGALAAYLPAKQAARVDPTRVLKND